MDRGYLEVKKDDHLPLSNYSCVFLLFKLSVYLCSKNILSELKINVFYYLAVFSKVENGESCIVNVF